MKMRFSTLFDAPIRLIAVSVAGYTYAAVPRLLAKK
jgi:hypothetical protein